MKIRHGFWLAAIALFLATPAFAQTRAQSLADIRQELSFLFVEVQELQSELSTTGSASGTGSNGTQLQRLDALEGELRRINGKVEELEFHIQTIVRDGTNRIGDLEFRLVELEGGDVSTLGETSTLGGELPENTTTVTLPADEGTEMAVSEQVDFETAKASYDRGELQASADQFGKFTVNYPGGPLTGAAHFWRGEALAGLEDWNQAARAFLQSFSSAPSGAMAPRALFRLGVSLDRIGQREEACLTLNEVDLRYPGSSESADAMAEMAVLDCAL